eukprot:gb/GFBE01056086.1/.p1 GENE.gb/GFBE01056086.1/~~gb/GFBE01056086.1/.p1  ORF type:complete len:207 (+),score=49.96 gb/GFBE01056086.1/:1-621(+)
MISLILQVANVFALIGWTWLLVHALAPSVAGLGGSSRAEGVQCANARSLFIVLQSYCGLEVLVIGFQRHIAQGSLKGFTQTGLGFFIWLFRVNVLFFVAPLLEHQLLHKVLLGGWAFSDVVRYLALIGKQVAALQKLRRLVSSIMFAVVASAEVYACWLVFGQFSGALQYYIAAQMAITVIGIPVGSYIFIAAASKGDKKSSKKDK